MSWRAAPAILALQQTLDAARPGRRARHSDGVIGDPAHSTRKSDHNPDSDRMVCAVDVHDSDELDDGSLYAAIKAAGPLNPVKYAINGGRIWSPERGERRYTGVNPHPDHCHVSVTQAGKRRRTPWVLPGITDHQPLTTPPPPVEDEMTADDWKRLEGRFDALEKKVDQHAVTVLRGPDHPSLTKLLGLLERIVKKVGA